MSKLIHLTGKKYPNKVSVVDDEDYDRIVVNPWFCISDPRTFYAVRTVWIAGKYTKIRMHVAIINPPLGMKVDHIDGDGLNNRKSNLRICTHAENMRNRKKNLNNSSGYIGVQKDTDSSLRREVQMWRATIKVDNKLKLLGIFEDPEEAAHVRDAAAREVYGEFASLNFPDPLPIVKEDIVEDLGGYPYCS